VVLQRSEAKDEERDELRQDKGDVAQLVPLACQALTALATVPMPISSWHMVLRSANYWACIPWHCDLGIVDMPRLTPFITVSAVVSPSMAEEIAHLAAANHVSKSHMVRQLLEERLTQRANERMEAEYERLEKRLARIEKRFSGLLVKGIRLSAQNLYLSMREMQDFTDLTDDALQALFDKSKIYAAKQLQMPMDDAGGGEAETKKP